MLSIHEISPELFFDISRAIKNASIIVMSHIHHVKWSVDNDKLIIHKKKIPNFAIEYSPPTPHRLAMTSVMEIIGEIAVSKYFKKKPIWRLIYNHKPIRNLESGMSKSEFKLFYHWIELRTINSVNCYWSMIETLAYEMRQHTWGLPSKYRISRNLHNPKKYHREGVVITKAINHLVNKFEATMSPKISSMINDNHKYLTFREFDFAEYNSVTELRAMPNEERESFLRWVHYRTYLKLKNKSLSVT